MIDYRNAMTAKELFNSRDKAAAFERFQAHPGLAEILAQMARAQRGEPLDGGDAAREGAEMFEVHGAQEEED